MRVAVHIPLLLLGLLSIPFLVTDLDLILQTPFYDATNENWPTGEHPFWKALYSFAPIPAILLGVASLLVLLFGIGRENLARFRKLAAYFALTLLVGSGLITNVILKGEWGRPRPKQVQVYGGAEEFERLLHYDGSSDGKSFPCGHATIGYYFLAFVPLLKGRRRLLALFSSLLFGTLIGIARLVQGGHFASDTLWAAAVMWFTALGFYKLLALDRSLYTESSQQRATPRWLPWATTPIFAALILLACTAWPYNKEFDLTPSNSIPRGTLILNYPESGNLEIIPGAHFTITCQADGHRFPKSKVRHTSLLRENTLNLTFKREGFFTELNLQTLITLPPSTQIQLKAPNLQNLLLDSALGKSVDYQLGPKTDVIVSSP